MYFFCFFFFFSSRRRHTRWNCDWSSDVCSSDLEGLFNLIKSIPATLKYEPGLIVAEGDFVILHGRFSGMGLLVNWIAADILRIENGILVEHWDVIQDETTKEQSKSKLPMFGSSFPVYAKPENTIG